MMSRRILTLSCLLLLMFLAAACAAHTQTPAPAPTEPPAVSTPPAPAPGDANWTRIQESGKLVVGTTVDYPPFVAYDANYRVDGFDAALIRKIAEELNLDVVFKDVAFAGLTDALSAEQIDVAVGAISITPERENLADFSQVYLVSADAVLAAPGSTLQIRSLEDLVPLVVGVEKGSVYENTIETALVDSGLMPNERLLSYTGMDQAFKDLAEGRIDVIVMDLIPAEEDAREGKGVIVARELSRQAYGIALKVGSHGLQDALNQALGRLQNEGEIAALAKQYLDIQELLPTPTPGVTPAVQPTPSGCTDSMAFVQDLNMPDYGMTKPPQVYANTPFSKGWRVLNTGTCTWDAGYILAYAGSSPIDGYLTGQPVRITRPVPPGSQTDLNVGFVAPAYPAVYMSFWTMRNASGEAFGDRLYLGVQVVSPAPQPTATAVPGITFMADKTSVGAGQPVNFYWQADGARKVAFGLAGAVQTVNNPGGSVQTPLMPSTYELRASYPDGSTKVRQISIDVSIDPGGPYIIDFTIDPPSITSSDCAVISWKIVNNVERVTLTRNRDTLTDGAPDASSFQDCPSDPGNYTYTLTAQGSGKSTRAQAYLTVNGPGPTDVPQPTWVPEPTEEPLPTFVPEPTQEPPPTFVPEPTEEPEPTWAPAPTDEPEPEPGPIDDGGDND